MSSAPTLFARTTENLVPLAPALHLLDAVVQVHPDVAQRDQQVADANPDLPGGHSDGH